MIALSMVLHRARSILGGFLALALGVTLMSASAIIIASAAPSVPSRYAQADILAVPAEAGVRYDGGQARGVWSRDAADAMTEELSQLAGVDAVVAESRFEVQVREGDDVLSDPKAGNPLGVGWSSFGLADQSLVAGVSPKGAQDLVLPDGLGRSPGDRVTVSTAETTRELTVVGITDGEDVLVADAVAEEIGPPVTLIGVGADPGAEVDDVASRVRLELGAEAEVFTGRDRAAAQSDLDTSSTWAGMQLLVLLGLVTVFVSVYVVGTTFAFQVATRRRELALLRAVGATPRQVRALLLREAATVGVAASVLGALTGIGGAPMLAAWMMERGLLSAHWEAQSIALPVSLAAGIGVGTALAGVLSASREAASVAPLEALAPMDSRERPRLTRTRSWAAGIALLLGAVSAITTVLAEQGASLVFAMGVSAALIVALAATAPAYLPHVFRVLPTRRFPTGELLRAEAGAGARRLASTMLPALLTAGLAVTMLGMNDTLAAALREHSSGDLPGEVAVRQVDGGPGITDKAVDTAAEVAGDRAATTLSTGVFIDGHWVEAVGLHQDAPPQDTVRASPAVAAEHGWTDGDTVELTWRDGTTGEIPVEVRELPSYAELWADLALPHDLAREHDPSTFISAAYVDGITADELADTLESEGATAEAVSVLIDEGIAEELQLLRLFTWVLLTLSVGYAAISTANTLSLSTEARRRDLGLLRVIGAHRRQVLALTISEAAVTAVVGLLAGVAASLPGLSVFAYGLRDDFDPREGPVDISVALPWPEILTVLGACLVVALIASAIPAFRAVRRPPGALVAEDS